MKMTGWVCSALAFAFLAGASAPALADSDLAYYQQFLYKKEISDDGDGEVRVQYRQLLADQEIAIDANQALVAHFELYLNADMTATLRYSEMFKVRADEHSDWRYDVREFCPTEINGPWSVPADQLVLGDGASMTGARDTWHAQNAVKLVFAQALKHPVLAGKSVTLSYGYSNVEKDAMKPPFCH